jgi:hypothetical protein
LQLWDSQIWNSSVYQSLIKQSYWNLGNCSG